MGYVKGNTPGLAGVTVELELPVRPGRMPGPGPIVPAKCAQLASDSHSGWQPVSDWDLQSPTRTPGPDHYSGLPCSESPETPAWHSGSPSRTARVTVPVRQCAADSEFKPEWQLDVPSRVHGCPGPARVARGLVRSYLDPSPGRRNSRRLGWGVGRRLKPFTGTRTAVGGVGCRGCGTDSRVHANRCIKALLRLAISRLTENQVHAPCNLYNPDSISSRGAKKRALHVAR